MKSLFHKPEAPVSYSLTADQQRVIYWETNHLFAKLYFDSNKLETIKRKWLSFRYCHFPAITLKEILPRTLTVIEAFTWVFFLSFLIRENDVMLSNVMEMKTDVNKPIKMTSH